MKKNFLFGLLALMLAGFGFGGVSMADEIGCSTGTEEGLRELLSQNACETITLTDNITITPYTGQVEISTATACGDNDSSICINREVTIDGSGHAISYSEMPKWLKNGGNYLFKTNIGDTETKKIILKNLTISNSLGGIFLYGNTELSLENVSFSNLEWGGVEIQNDANPKFGTINNVKYDNESIETPFAWVDGAFSGSLNWENSNILDCHFIEKPDGTGYQKQYFCFLKKLNTKTYYTSDSTNSTEFKLVLNDDGSFLNKTGTLYILGALYKDTDKNDSTKLYAQLSGATAEQLSGLFQTGIIEDEEVLFLHLGNGEQTKVFRAEKDGALSGNVFKPSTYTIPASQVSFSTGEADRVAPRWIEDFSSENLSGVIEVGKGYIVHTKGGGLFYAPRMYKVIFNTNAEGVANPEAKELKYGEKVAKPNPDPTYTGYIFQGWYLDDKEFDFDTLVTESLTLTGKWESIAPSTGDAEDETTYASGFVFDAEEGLTGTDTKSSIESAVASSNSNATMQGAAELNVYSDEDDSGTLNDGDAPITGKVNFKTPVLVRIPVSTTGDVKVKVRHNGETTFGTEGLTTDSAATCNDGIASAPYNGSDIKVTSGYAEIYTCSASTFIAYTETAKPAPSYGGRGGGSSSSSSKATTTDTKATTGDNKTVDTTKTNENLTNNNGTNKDGYTPAYNDKYSKEFNDAYQFAYKNGITTMPSIEEADMESPLTRIAMAKMLSQYAINVLGKTPDTTKVVPAFPDVTAQMDADYNNGVTLAYQLGIMGIGIDKFRPNDLVTRAEFATALSRLLFNTPDGEGAYYETHLAKLMEEKIITNNNPDLQELRGYVMIMLMRSAQS